MKMTQKLAIVGLALCIGSGVALADPPTGPAGPPIAPLPPGVTLRAATVRVAVAPDHRDWTYRLGEPALFNVTVTADNEPIDDVTVTYTVGPDMFPGEKKTAALPLAGIAINAGTMNQPGFLRCIVTAQVAGHSYRGLATAAFAPAKINLHLRVGSRRSDGFHPLLTWMTTIRLVDILEFSAAVGSRSG